MPTKRRLAFIGLPSPLGRGSSEGAWIGGWAAEKLSRTTCTHLARASVRTVTHDALRFLGFWCLLRFSEKRGSEKRGIVKADRGPHALAGQSHAAPRTPLESPWAARTTRVATGSELAPTANTWRGSSADAASGSPAMFDIPP